MEYLENKMDDQERHNYYDSIRHHLDKLETNHIWLKQEIEEWREKFFDLQGKYHHLNKEYSEKMAEYHYLKNKIDRASIKDRIKFLFLGKV